MELTFLGTASAYPSPTRGVSCTIFRRDGTYWMFDCGEGSQIQLMKSHIRPGKISKIFISHLHGDHVFGLPGFLCTVSQNYCPDASSTLEIYGPCGLRRLLRESLNLSRSQLGASFVVHELKPREEQYPDDWQTWRVDHNDTGMPHPMESSGGRTIEPDDNLAWRLCYSDGLTVTAGMLLHNVPSFGFVIEEDSSPGKLDVNKLKDLGLSPGPLYKQLKMGETVLTPEGVEISPASVLGPSRSGRKVCILGDSRDSSHMVDLCSCADVIVHEATLPDEMEENAQEKGHSTPAIAGKFALGANAKQLILTHFSQRICPQKAENTAGKIMVEELLSQGKVAFQSDNVIAAHDFLTISVPPNS